MKEQRKQQEIPEELLKPRAGENGGQWLARLLAAKIDVITALNIIKIYNAEKALKSQSHLDTKAGFGSTGPKNPGEEPDQMED